MSGKGFRIVSVEIEAFRGYEEKVIYNFPKESQVFLFSGPNGYGKTTFFDSIEWVLTGEISRISENIELKKDRKNPTEQSLINNISNKRKGNYAEVTLRFLLDNIAYEIKRESSIYNKDYLKANTKLYLKTNGILKEINGAWIDSLFNEEELTSYKLSEKFSSYHLCSHEKNLKVLQKNRENLHDMLSILFGENKFSLYRNNIKELLDGITLKVKRKQEEFNTLFDSGKELLNNKNLGSFDNYLFNYNSWLLPNEVEIKYENILDNNLSDKRNMLKEILNIFKDKDKYINNKRYLEYRKKENEYQLFITNIESIYNETKEIIKEKDFSFNKLESEQKSLLLIKESIMKLKKGLGTKTINREFINLLQDFLVKNDYKLKNINIDELLNINSLLEELQEKRNILKSEEEEKLNFQDNNSNFINFLSYAQKHIEAEHISNNCPLCNQEIPIEALKKIIEYNQNSFTKLDRKISKLKDEYKQMEKETLFLMEKFNQEIESVLVFIDTKLRLYLNTLQQKPRIEKLEQSLKRYSFTINEIDGNIINTLKEEQYAECKESLKSFNQDEIIPGSFDSVRDFIFKYERKLYKYKEVIQYIDSEKIQSKIDNLEKIIENNTYLLFKKKTDKVKDELDILIEKQKLIKKVKNSINSAVNQMETMYKNELEEPINYVYRKINRHSNFSEINISLPSGATNKKVDTTVSNGENTINLSNVLSSGQVTTVALSFFLGIAFKKRFAKFNAYFFDDPIQHMDDLNILSFIDLLRGHLKDGDFANQVFLSTCNEDMDNLLVSKMKHFSIGVTKFNFRNYAEFEKFDYSNNLISKNMS